MTEEIKFEKTLPITKELSKMFFSYSKEIMKNINLSENEQLLILITFINILEKSISKKIGKEELSSIKTQIDNLNQTF